MNEENKKTYFYGIVDIGSYEISLTIASFNQGLPQIVERVKRILPLGADTYKKGAVSEENIDLLLEVLEDFKRKLKEYPDTKLSVVATSAVNEARNRPFIVERVRQVLGSEVQVLNSSEEAYILQLALQAYLPDFSRLKDEGVLILDLGYGSIQLTLYSKGRFIFTQNILLGSLRVRAILAELEQHTTNFQDLMSEYISGDLAYYHSFQPKRTQYKNLIMTGFGLEYWRQLLDLPLTGVAVLSKEDFLRLQESMTLNGTKRLRSKQIPEEHAGLLLPMSLVMRQVFEFTKLNEAYLPDISIEEGVLLRNIIAAGQLTLEFDPYDTVVDCARQMAKRYRTDKKHIEHVAKLAINIFDQTQELHALQKEDRLLLQVGALLHNVGKYVSMKHDESLSFHLIQSSDLIGLNQAQLDIVAMLARYHNGDWDDHQTLRSLSESDYIKVAKLTAILAVANALDAGHKQKINEVDIRITRNKVHFNVHTNKDITLEKWNLKEQSQTFEDVFGKRTKLNNK